MAICMKYLFVCVENAARSQMAEAFAREMGIEAASAGTLPAGSINPSVIKAMQEIGIDMSGYRPKLLTLEMIEHADIVVTMGCSIEGVCPAPMLRRMKKKLIEWNIEDPNGKPMEEVRRIRDDIKEKIISLVKSK
jgi:arsenate reductase